MTTTIEKPIQEPQLPALEIEVRGEVVTSNAAAFMSAIREWLGSFKTDLQTDEDFAEAEANAKLLSEKEKAITAAKDKALADAEQLHDLLKTLDDGSEEIRQTRLTLERQIKAKKEEIREQIIADAVAEIVNGHGEKFRSNLVNALKGKRSLSSIREAVGVVVTTANGQINENRQLLAAHHAEHGNDLIPDRKALELTATAAQLETELNARVERRKAAEAQRKAEAEAAAARAELEEQKRKAAAAEAAAKQAQEAPHAPAQQPEAQKVADRPVQTQQPTGDIPTPATSPVWEEWLDAVVAALSPLKAAREQITNPVHKAKAEAFAEAVRVAYKEMVS